MSNIQLKVHSQCERQVYYVYVYIDPRNDEPIWVGKGMGDRYSSHTCAKTLHDKEPFHQRLLEIIEEGVTPEVRLVLEHLEETEALYFEAFFIEAIGRRNDPINPGPLLNLRAGGNGNRNKTYRGVAKKGSKFKANISHKKRSVHLGYFDTIEDAARASDQAYVERDGEETVFHKLNFPEEWDGIQCLRDWVERRPGTNKSEKQSKYRGVVWEPRRHRPGRGWRKAGWRCGISTRLGKKLLRCRDELTAARKYDELAKKFQGVRARVNFPDEWDGDRCLRDPVNYRRDPRETQGLKPHEDSARDAIWNTPDPKPKPEKSRVPDLGGGPRVSGRGYVRGPNPGKRFKGIWQETIVIQGTKYPLPNAWHARIKVDGKYRSLGKHTSSEKAARAFDAAAIVYQAEPWLNFPEEHERINPLRRGGQI